MDSSKFTHIQGIVLEMSSESQTSFDEQTKVFQTRPDNLRKNIRIHLSLMLTAIQEHDRLAKLPEFLESFFSKVKPVTIEVGKPEKVAVEYIAVPVVSEELTKTHYALLDFLQPVLAEQFNPKYLNQNLSEKELRYLHKYGYHRIREFYKAHITIGQYATTEIQDSEFQSAPIINGEFHFNKVVLDDCIDKSEIPSDILWSKQLNDSNQK